MKKNTFFKNKILRRCECYKINKYIFIPYVLNITFYQIYLTCDINYQISIF
jgi:hypothetical protein